MKKDSQIAGLFRSNNCWRYTKENGDTDYSEPFEFRDWVGSIFVTIGLWIAGFKIK